LQFAVLPKASPLPAMKTANKTGISSEIERRLGGLPTGRRVARRGDIRAGQ
jgi:hypothetical protein